MTCQPVEPVEASEPVAPCSRWEFEAILAPIVKLCKRIVKDNDPERRGEDCPDPLTGADTFEIRDAIFAKIDWFVYWWRCQNATALGEAICNKDDAKLAATVLGSVKAGDRRADERGEAKIDVHPDVCAARSHLQASIIHSGAFALLEKTPFRALVQAPIMHDAKYLRVMCEGTGWHVSVKHLRNVVKTLCALKRTERWSIRIDWNVGVHPCVPTFTFTWGIQHDGSSKGRLRVPMSNIPAGYNDQVVTFTADRTVGRVFQSVDEYLKALPSPPVVSAPEEPASTPEPVESPDRWPVQPIPAGVVPANEVARVSGEKAEQPMSSKTTTTSEPTNTSAKPAIDALAHMDQNKWSISAYPAVGAKKQAVVCIYSNATNKPTQIGKGKGASIPEAYADALQSIANAEF